MDSRACYKMLIACTYTLGAIAFCASAHGANKVLNESAMLYVDRYSDVVFAASYALAGDDRTTALTIAAHPIATWFTGGTPAEVKTKVAKLIADATAEKKLAVLVAYNVPFRDCSQYSAGGAKDTAAYKAWIDGLVAGIGQGRAVVLLEPDGLGIIPHYVDINGNKEWCQPAELDPTTAANERFEQMNYAVDKLTALKGVATYLDGTHSSWLGVGDVSNRLVKAGVQKAAGFFLNVSNYELTSHLQKYGTWISKCIHYGTNTAEGGWRVGHFDWCASQYYPANPADFGSWSLTDAWYTENVDNAVNPPTVETLRHFVIDTSRNGRGPWTPIANTYSDPQAWCNPPGRGLGDRPTTKTNEALLDAKLWIKVPGESDGQCTRGTAGPTDPERGMIDPPAGKWFKQQAAELVELAQPALTSALCRIHFDEQASWPGAFVADVAVKNLSNVPIHDWNLSWAFPHDEEVVADWGANLEQSRGVVTAHPAYWNRLLWPNGYQSFGFLGKQQGQLFKPLLLFFLNGSACTVH